jgi:hypothetical protein
VSRAYSERIAEERRLTMLTILKDMPEHRLNLAILYSELDALAVPCTLVDLRADAEWLASQRLIERTEIVKGVTVLTLTADGLDVARGKRLHPGVMRPGP